MPAETRCPYVGPCDGSYCVSLRCADGSGGTGLAVSFPKPRFLFDGTPPATVAVRYAGPHCSFCGGRIPLGREGCCSDACALAAGSDA